MLKFVRIIALGILFSFTTIVTDAPEWNIDYNHSSIGFEVNHFFTPVAGSFKSFDGSLNFDPENLAGSSASFTVDVSSIETDNKKRNDHLGSEDFFNTDAFPIMKFESSSFKKGSESYSLMGKLTIRDITKDITIPLKLLGYGDHPLKKGKLIIALQSEFIINRNDYGVGTGDWSSTAVVGDEVKIKVLLEATRNK